MEEQQPEEIEQLYRTPSAWLDYLPRLEKLVRPTARDTAAISNDDDISGLLLDAGDALNDAGDALGRLRAVLEALRVEVTVVEDG